MIRLSLETLVGIIVRFLPDDGVRLGFGPGGGCVGSISRNQRLTIGKVRTGGGAGSWGFRQSPLPLLPPFPTLPSQLEPFREGVTRPPPGRYPYRPNLSGGVRS